ncbi:Major facilitator superfamily domain, general substrate transporter [Akanthomyces lecanii RCEF 1005]|uniref:Major facilitator superfamily domain, general substrate transporter n=1 Tax=Akanthomyces lecanii RCEF 1005 TaxID=1081108 RepID=A0A168C059_CORDF|nr:Major facilitator superfamily domain, general substrate transporter [Akanthomyces lecanii RCEF 1005]
MKLWDTVHSLFLNGLYPRAPYSEQPLLRNGVPTPEAGTSAEDGSAPEGHRDAAAMLLIRLGRSPNERIHVSPKDDSRVLRRIDLALLPLMLSVYFLQALDKATLSYASIFGLIEDTKLVGNQFSWLGSIVFLAQLVMQLPLALALVKLPIGKFTGAMVLGWGLTLTAMTWASTFSQLMAARFFLGAFEASVGPSFVAITQMWWRRREQTMRIGSWYCMNGLTWVFGSLATYGLASITSSLRPYQIIFLTFGIVTVVVAGAMFIWMPDSPTEAKFLTDDDKLIAIERLRGNQMGVMSREWRQAHFYEALQDVKTWLWVAMILCISVPSNGISTFGPLIIHSFVSDPFDTILFNVPVGISHVISVSVSAYVSMKWKVKGLVIILLCIPPIIGFSILLSFPHDDAHRAILVAGYFCLSTFTGITPLVYSWSAQNTAGDTKRKSTSALVFIGSSAGNIIGPLLFTPDEAPSYSRGLKTNIALFSAVILLALLTSAHLKWLNKKHAERRVALGKKAVVFDSSLETAREVDRMGTIQGDWERDTRLHNGELGSSLDHPEGQNSDYEEESPNSNAFADLTDLENEDFIFVF